MQSPVRRREASCPPPPFPPCACTMCRAMLNIARCVYTGSKKQQASPVCTKIPFYKYTCTRQPPNKTTPTSITNHEPTTHEPRTPTPLHELLSANKFASPQEGNASMSVQNENCLHDSRRSECRVKATSPFPRASNRKIKQSRTGQGDKKRKVLRIDSNKCHKDFSVCKMNEGYTHLRKQNEIPSTCSMCLHRSLSSRPSNQGRIRATQQVDKPPGPANAFQICVTPGLP